MCPVKIEHLCGLATSWGVVWQLALIPKQMRAIHVSAKLGVKASSLEREVCFVGPPQNYPLAMPELRAKEGSSLEVPGTQLVIRAWYGVPGNE